MLFVTPCSPSKRHKFPTTTSNYMSNKRRNRKTGKGARNTALGRARAQTRLAANITQEQDWYLDTPDVRLTRIFAIVLLLHGVAFGGILAFKMVDKASANTGVTISSANSVSKEAVQENKEVAARVESAAVSAEEPARQRPPAPLRPDRNAENQYKVQAGETLTEIAASLGVSPEALRKANSIISDNELYPGRWLNLPDKEAATAAPATAPERPAQTQVSNASPAPQAAKYYEVVPGDTAWGISRKLQVSFKDLMKINGINRPETLQIGQKLKVPAGN